MQTTSPVKVQPLLPQLPPITASNSDPFKIPNDSDILLHVDSRQKQKLKQQKIWQKTTASCGNPLIRFDKYQTAIDYKYVPVNTFNPKQKKLIQSALQIIQTRKKNKDLLAKNQTVVDILQQKKQMFLVTMTHGIIQKQIKNLKQQASQRQKALKQSNQILNQDIEDFQQFQQKQKNQIKQIEDKYQDMIKKRLIKQQQIKNKQIIFNSLKAQKLKNQQNLSSYQKYKKFLNQLPPQQWLNNLFKKKQFLLLELKNKYFLNWNSNNYDKKNYQIKNKIQFDLFWNKLKDSGENQEIQEVINNEEMYFKQPNELIQYFNNLQQANLFCIQNVQIADQKLQQLLLKSHEKKKQLNTKYQTQTHQKQTLQKHLLQLQNQIKLLKKKKQQNCILDSKDNKDIKSLIATQYQNMKDTMTITYLPEIQQTSEALSLLSGIQICMQRLWEKLHEYYLQNPKGLKQLKNQYEKKKTAQKRQKAARTNNEEQQKRKQRNLEKKQPNFKLYGRVDMKRSAPNEKIVKKKAEIKDKDINDDIQYLQQ